MLEIIVHEIRGRCLVYKKGDKITIKDPEIILEKTDALCTHALATLLHYSIILDNPNADYVALGLATPGNSDEAYLQCVDPGPPLTGGGTVVFQVRRV